MNVAVAAVLVVHECGRCGRHGQDVQSLLAVAYRVLCCALCFVFSDGLRLTWICDILILRKEHTRVYKFTRLLHYGKCAVTST